MVIARNIFELRHKEIFENKKRTIPTNNNVSLNNTLLKYGFKKNFIIKEQKNKMVINITIEKIQEKINELHKNFDKDMLDHEIKMRFLHLENEIIELICLVRLLKSKLTIK